MACDGKGYLKPPEHLCLPGKNLSGYLKLCALSSLYSPDVYKRQAMATGLSLFSFTGNYWVALGIFFAFFYV